LGLRCERKIGARRNEANCDGAEAATGRHKAATPKMEEIMTKLHILNGPKIGRSFELSDVATYVGRSLDNDIQIEDKTVSRKHLKIVKSLQGVQSLKGEFTDK